MIDPAILIAASLWCGVPNLPMTNSRKDEKINECRKELIQCVLDEGYVNLIPEKCLGIKLQK